MLTGVLTHFPYASGCSEEIHINIEVNYNIVLRNKSAPLADTGAGILKKVKSAINVEQNGADSE